MDPKVVYSFSAWMDVAADGFEDLLGLERQAVEAGLETQLVRLPDSGFDHHLRVSAAGDDPRLLDALNDFRLTVDRLVTQSVDSPA